MAVAVYDSDLTSANSGEITIADNATLWDESSDAAWDDEGTNDAETNFYIQGAECISAQFTKDGVGTIINFEGATFTVDTDGAVLIWCFWASPASCSTYAAGGIRTLCGNSLGDFYVWRAAGSNFEPNPLGGWYCYAVDPDTATAHATVGSPDDTWTHVGMAISATAQSRGNPFAVDAIRAGRCTLEVTEGQAAAYGTFAGMNTFDISTDQQYGLFQNLYGSYRWQGLMSLGVTGTAVDFRDANANITVANTPMVSANFNKIEIHNSGSNIEWSAVNISSPGVSDPIVTTNSPGKFEMIDDADLAFTSCTFTDMDTFIFSKSTNTVTLDTCTWRRCGLVTTGGSSFDACLFDDTADTVKAITVSSPANAALITNSEFISGGTKHGLEITGTAANCTLTNVTWTGYASSDGSSGDEAIYVNIGSGIVNITIAGSSIPSIRTAGATVNVLTNAVDLEVTVLDLSTTATISGARVLVWVTDGTNFPYLAAISGTGTSTTATINHTAHGFSTDDNVIIKGANEDVYNGVYQITVNDANEYEYTTNETISVTPATGSLTSTFAYINGTTDTNGYIIDSRSISAAQPISGRVRMSSASPFYQQGSITGEVNNTTGFSTTIQLAGDE